MAIASAANASPPPAHLANKQILNFKFQQMLLFYMHSDLRGHVASTNGVGGHLTLTAQYFDASSNTVPYAVRTTTVIVPASGAVVGWDFDHGPPYPPQHVETRIQMTVDAVEHPSHCPWPQLYCVLHFTGMANVFP